MSYEKKIRELDNRLTFWLIVMFVSGMFVAFSLDIKYELVKMSEEYCETLKVKL